MTTRATRHAVILVVVIAAFATRSLGAPLADYQARLESAMSDVAFMFDDEDSGPSDASKGLAHARELLPPKEVVDLDGQSIEVDNAWLGEQIDAYEAATDVEARRAMLEAIETRLYAANVQIYALSEAPAHASAAERAKLAEILSRSQFQPPGESPLAAFIRRVRTKVLYYLQKIFEWLFGGSRGSGTYTGLRVIIIALGAVALLLLVRSLAIALARGGLGRKRERVKKPKKVRTVLGEEVDESTTAIDIASAARALAASGDHRGAIRKLFVALIYQLDERGLVHLRSDATNREYLRLVRSIALLHPVMASMTDVFDRVWYGQIPVGVSDYAAFESMYTQAASIAAESTAVAGR